jgi:hypothetical protein
VIAGLASPMLDPAYGAAGQRDPFGWAHSAADQHSLFDCAYSGARHEAPFQCVHGGAEPSGECTCGERETSTPPTAPARRHRHHRVNVSTLTGDTEVPPDKTRRIHRHRESGTHEGITGQPSRTRSPHRHSKGEPAAAPGASPSSTRKVIEGQARNTQKMRQLLSERRNQRRSRNCAIKQNTNATKASDEVTGRVTGCDGSRRKGGNGGGHENCASRQNTNATKLSVPFVVAACLLLIRFCSLLPHVSC